MANILKFKRVSQYTPSVADAGAIVFESSKKILHVITEDGLSEIYSGVRRARIENKKLIINNENGDDLTIDFSDVASAQEVANAIKVLKVDPSDATPLANAGSGNAGTSAAYARGDHAHPLQESVSKLDHNLSISLTGGATGSASNIDFSGNAVSINVASLDATKLTGEIPLASIPKGALERLVVVANETAATEHPDVQEGDVVQVTGNDNKMYYCVANSGTFSERFKEFTAGTASSVKWSGITEKPATLVTNVTESGEGTVYVGHNVANNTLTLTKGKVVNSIDGKTGAFTVKDETTNLKVRLSVSSTNEISGEVVNIGTMASKSSDDYLTASQISSTYETKSDATAKKTELSNSINAVEQKVNTLKESIEAGTLYWARFE